LPNPAKSAFVRHYQGESIIVALNNADSASYFSLSCPRGGYRDLLTDSDYYSQNDELELNIPAG